MNTQPQPEIMDNLVKDFRAMLDGGLKATDLLARGYNPQLVEAAVEGTLLDDIVRRHSTMPKSVEAIRQTVMIY